MQSRALTIVDSKPQRCITIVLTERQITHRFSLTVFTYDILARCELDIAHTSLNRSARRRLIYGADVLDGAGAGRISREGRVGFGDAGTVAGGGGHGGRLAHVIGARPDAGGVGRSRGGGDDGGGGGRGGGGGSGGGTVVRCWLDDIAVVLISLVQNAPSERCSHAYAQLLVTLPDTVAVRRPTLVPSHMQ